MILPHVGPDFATIVHPGADSYDVHPGYPGVQKTQTP